MNKLTKIQKIISVVLLCFTFFILLPIETFALTTSVPNARKEVGVVGVGTTQINWLTAGLLGATSLPGAAIGGGLTTLGFPPVEGIKSDIRLDTVLNGKQDITTNHYTALTIAAKGGYENKAEKEWVNPFTGKPYEKENIYTIGTSDGVSYYYKPNGGTDAERNANTVLIAHAAGGEVYFPEKKFNTDGTEIVNYIPKGSNEEKAFYNSIDTEKGRQPGTTLQKLTDVDQKEVYQQVRNQTAAELAKLEQQQRDDDEAVARGDANAVTPAAREARAELDQRVETTRSNLQRQNAAVARSVEAIGQDTVKLQGCPEGASGVATVAVAGFAAFLNPSCVVSVFAIIGNVVLKLSAYVLYLTGQLFDYSIEIAVNSAQFIQSLAVVDPTWAAIRDFFNMTFIFVLIYISWQILLGRAGYNAKNSVGRLVLVAILINFSLFAAKLMVDSSNIISLNIYEGIKARDGISIQNDRGSISARIMTTLGLSTIYNFGDAFDNRTIAGCGDVPSTILSVSVFGTILIIITAMTFLLPAILFFLRLLNIIALFVTSPAWVYGHVMPHPWFKNISDKWFSNMMQVVKFPVLYMLMLYVALAMFSQLININTGNNLSIISVICQTALEKGKSKGVIFDQIPMILNFILVIAAMLGILKWSVGETSKAALTGKLASKIAGGFSNFSQKISTGAAQGLYNKSAGAVNFAANNAMRLGTKPFRAAGGAIKQGVQYGALKATSSIANTLGTQAAKSQNPLMREMFAAMSTKAKEAKVFGDTKEEAEKKRVAGAIKTQTMVSKVLSDQTKIDSKEKWEKENVGGDYEKYLDAKINLIEDVYLGSLKDASAQKDKDGNAIKNADFIRQQAFDITKNADGSETRKFNQHKLNATLKTIRETHSKDGSLLKAQKRFEIFTEEKTAARIKEVDKALRSSIVGKQKSIEDKEKEKLAKIQSLSLLPEIESVVPSKVAEYHSIIRSYVKAVQKTEEDMARKLGARLSPDEERIIREKAETDISILKQETKEKILEEREKIQNKIEKIDADIRKMKEEAAKK